MIRSVVMLAPEAPYPLHGGGAYRTASLLNYFAQTAAVDLILISESGRPALLPKGLVREQTVIPLPRHGRDKVSRYLRNAGRLMRGIPPLVDRLSGLEDQIARALEGKSYDLGIVEHFWCAPYVRQLEKCCTRTVLDLHNIESVLHSRCASVEKGLIGAGHARFAQMYGRLETTWLPKYSALLATSETDAVQVKTIAPASNVLVYPNALPMVAAPVAAQTSTIVFSGNFEYHPNIDAAGFLISEIWPAVRAEFPAHRLRLVGRGEQFIRHLVKVDSGIEMTGEVESALDEIATAEVVVAPLRAGSGTRIKILEAWAAGRPVVATPLAAEGLAVRDAENILLATGADELAKAVCALLGDAERSKRLGKAGRQTFEERYTWAAAWRALDCLR